MSKTPINMIDLCNLAWDRKSKCSTSEYYTKTKNLLSHAYVEYKNLFVDYCNRKGIKYEDQVFYAFQRVLTFLMFSDNDCLRGEYDCYCEFCNYARFEALSPSECRQSYDNHTVDDLLEEIGMMLNLRDSIDPENYEAMVQGFCYFALSGDKAMDENEYYILRCFFQNGYDKAPSSWEEFKRLW